MEHIEEAKKLLGEVGPNYISDYDIAPGLDFKLRVVQVHALISIAESLQKLAACTGDDSAEWLRVYGMGG